MTIAPARASPSFEAAGRHEPVEQEHDAGRENQRNAGCQRLAEQATVDPGPVERSFDPRLSPPEWQG